MKYVYVVQASSGEYDDYREYNLVAFEDESRAKAVVEECSDILFDCNESLNDVGDEDPYLNQEYHELSEEEANRQYQKYDRRREAIRKRTATAINKAIGVRGEVTSDQIECDMMFVYYRLDLR